MGGDTFEGVERLTDSQFKQYSGELLEMLAPISMKAEPYIPLPEKQSHGDIDILLMPKPGFTCKDLVNFLKPTKYIINNNNTVNSIFKNKQVDYCLVSSDSEFQVKRFYKSFSGLGAYLGLFLPSREVKLSDRGLFAIGYHKHLKLEFLLTDQVQEILQFYGLSHEVYTKGFQTKKQLFEYLRQCRFIDETTIVNMESKHRSKLDICLCDYLCELQQSLDYKPVLKQPTKLENPLEDTLHYFDKQEQFHHHLQNMILEFETKQRLSKKFNATHLMARFGIHNKKVNCYKREFMDHFGSQSEYQEYIDSHSLEEILQDFGKWVPIQDEKYEHRVSKKGHGRQGAPSKKEETPPQVKQQEQEPKQGAPSKEEETPPQVKQQDQNAKGPYTQT